MIITEYLNEGTLVKHYSDQGFLLLQNETGTKYAEPIDVVPCQYTYTEINGAEEPSEDEEEISGDEITGEELLSMIKEVM